ncbi:hypothetical protein Tco_0924108 [Tanacetum coccineum]|uniref:Uncharacterized protein n=1 Tax=Tanacetum coccineum TaxID=301880 RepID=A0ABQ5D994_9ASTR
MELMVCYISQDGWKQISKKRTKNQAKNNKIEHGMEKREKTTQIEAKVNKSQRKDKKDKKKHNQSKTDKEMEKTRQE